MKVLAIETATVAGGVAIVDEDNGLIAELRVDIKIAHAERLMPSLQWLLKASRLSIHDIDAFAVSIGPGSFTGLRIGLSTAKGLSFASNKPIVPVRTLDAFARTIPFCAYLICPMLDARRKEVYAALYRWDGNECRKVMPEAAVDPAGLLQQIREPVVFMGEGALTYQALIRDTLKDRAVFAPPSHRSPSAASVAELALEKLNQGIETDPVSLVPFYIRKSEAEIRCRK